MLTGGLAVTAFDVARSTLDVDITIWVDPDQQSSVIDLLTRYLPAMPANPHEFVESTRVLPLTAEGPVRVEIIFGRVPAERDAVERAVLREIAGRPVRVATVEDLILMKVLSSRPKDAEDVRQLVRRHRSALDREYLDPRVRSLSLELDMPEIWESYSDALMRP